MRVHLWVSPQAAEMISYSHRISMAITSMYVHGCYLKAGEQVALEKMGIQMGKIQTVQKVC